MFADPKTQAEPGLSKTVAPFWHSLFDKLKCLLGFQLVVCPQSSAHDRESVLSCHHTALKEMFEALSLGVSFYDFETIKRFQLSEQLQRWLTDQPERTSEINPNKLLRRDPHVWTDRFLITVNLGQIPGYINAVNVERKAVHESLSRVFQHWKENADVTWEQWFEDEALDYGPSVLKAYSRDLEKFREVREGRQILSQDVVFPTQSQILISMLMKKIRDAGVTEDQVRPKLSAFCIRPI